MATKKPAKKIALKPASKPAKKAGKCKGGACAKQYPSFTSTHALRIIEHYHNARAKHPYFCDMVTRDLWTVPVIQANIRHIRQYISEDVKRHEVEALSLIICEMREFEEAMTLKDTARAVEKCYDCIAVLLRTIDVLEGRQPLGRTEEREASE